MDVQVNNGSGNGYRVILHNYSNIGRGVCEYPEQINSYLENLDRLEIISITDEIIIIDDNKYNPIRNDPYFSRFLHFPVEEGKSVVEKKKSFHTTNFGLNFLETCV